MHRGTVTASPLHDSKVACALPHPELEARQRSLVCATNYLPPQLLVGKATIQAAYN